MVLAVTAIALVGMLVAAYVLSGKELIAPAVLYSLGFALCAVVACLSQGMWGVDLHVGTTCALIVGSVCFVGTSVLVRRLIRCRHATLTPSSRQSARTRESTSAATSGRPRQPEQRARKKRRNPLAARLPVRRGVIVGLIAVQAIVFIWTLVAICRMYPADSIANSVYQFNLASTFGEGPISLGFPLAQVRNLAVASGYLVAFLLAQEVVDRHFGNAALLTGSFVLCLAMELETGSRTGVIALAGCALLMYALLRKRNARRPLRLTPKLALVGVALFALVLLVFQAMAIGRNLSGYGFFEYLAEYLGAEIVNLDIFLQGDPPADDGVFGTMTFVRTINYLGSKLGISAWVYSLDLPFNHVNDYNLGNVYTTYYAFLYDFGPVGLVVLTVVMAAISQAVYERAYRRPIKRWADLWVIVYAYIGYQLLMCFFSNKFYENVISITFLRLLVYLIIVRFVYCKLPRSIDGLVPNRLSRSSGGPAPDRVSEPGQPGMKRRSTKANFAFQASYQVLLILIPLITTPYLSRVLGAEAVGVFSYTQAVAGYFVMVAMLGMSTYGVREIAAAGDDRALRSRTFWSAWAFQLLMGIAVCVIYVAYLAIANTPGGVLVGVVWGMYVISAPLDISWLLFGVQEFKVPTLCSAATKLATLPVIFGFVHGPGDLWIYCAAIAGSLLVGHLLLWPLVRRYVDWARPSWNLIVSHVRPSLLLFVPVVAISLYTMLDKILLGSIAGMEQAGIFEYSEKLSRMPMAIITAMGTVMLPRMTSELNAGQREKALDLLETSIWAMIAMAMALAFGIAAIAPEFAPVFLGEEFTSAAPVMAVLAIIIPLVSATNVIGRQYLVPTGRDRMFTVSVCVGAVVNVVVNLILIPFMGAMGAAVASVAAEATVLVAQARSTAAELPLARYALGAAPFAVCGIVMLMVVRLLSALMGQAMSLSPLGLVVEIAVGAAVFAALALIWCMISRNEQFRKLIGRRRLAE